MAIDPTLAAIQEPGQQLEDATRNWYQYGLGQDQDHSFNSGIRNSYDPPADTVTDRAEKHANDYYDYLGKTFPNLSPETALYARNRMQTKLSGQLAENRAQQLGSAYRQESQLPYNRLNPDAQPYSASGMHPDAFPNHPLGDDYWWMRGDEQFKDYAKKHADMFRQSLRQHAPELGEEEINDRAAALQRDTFNSVRKQALGRYLRDELNRTDLSEAPRTGLRMMPISAELLPILEGRRLGQAGEAYGNESASSTDLRKIAEAYGRNLTDEQRGFWGKLGQLGIDTTPFVAEMLLTGGLSAPLEQVLKEGSLKAMSGVAMPQVAKEIAAKGIAIGGTVTAVRSPLTMPGRVIEAGEHQRPTEPFEGLSKELLGNIAMGTAGAAGGKLFESLLNRWNALKGTVAQGGKYEDAPPRMGGQAQPGIGMQPPPEPPPAAPGSVEEAQGRVNDLKDLQRDHAMYGTILEQAGQGLKDEVTKASKTGNRSTIRKATDTYKAWEEEFNRTKSRHEDIGSKLQEAQNELERRQKGPQAKNGMNGGPGATPPSPEAAGVPPAGDATAPRPGPPSRNGLQRLTEARKAGEVQAPEGEAPEGTALKSQQQAAQAAQAGVAPEPANGAAGAADRGHLPAATSTAVGPAGEPGVPAASESAASAAGVLTAKGQRPGDLLKQTPAEATGSEAWNQYLAESRGASPKETQQAFEKYQDAVKDLGIDPAIAAKREAINAANVKVPAKNGMRRPTLADIRKLQSQVEGAEPPEKSPEQQIKELEASPAFQKMTEQEQQKAVSDIQDKAGEGFNPADYKVEGPTRARKQGMLYEGNRKAARAGSVTIQPLVDAMEGGKDAAKMMHYEIDRQAGKMAPRMTSLDRETGEAASRFMASTIYAHKASPYLIDRVMWPKATDADRTLAGAVMTEWHLRYTKQSYNQIANDARVAAAQARAAGNHALAAEKDKEASDAAQVAGNVTSIIGQPNSPLQSFADYRNELQSPRMQGALQRWRQHVVPIMEENYRKGQGLDPTDPIDSRTQVPDYPMNLKALGPDEEDTPTTVKTGQGARGGWDVQRLRKYPWANQRTGDAERYDLDLGNIIMNSLEKGTKTANKADWFRTGVKNNVFQWGQPGVPREIQGEKAIEIPNVRPPKGTQEEAKGFNETSLYVHPDAYAETKWALGKEEPYRVPYVSKFLNGMTGWTLTGSGSEMTYHGLNNLMALFEPGVNPFMLPYYLIKNTLSKSPDIQKRIVDLAKEGAMKDHGWEWGGGRGFFGGGKLDPTSWASRGLDIINDSMRLLLDDAFTRMTKRSGWGLGGKVEDTPTNRRDFINQALGQYNKLAQSRIVVALRDSGLNPTATAGFSWWWKTQRSLSGTPSGGNMGTSGIQNVKLRAEMLAKLLLPFAGTAVASYLMWGDPFPKDVPFGTLKTGENEDGTSEHVDWITGMTGIPQALKRTGAYDVLEGQRHGTSPGTTLGKAAERIGGGVAHPMVGPPGQFLKTALTGKNMVGQQLAEKAANEGEQDYNNLWAAIWNSNPTLAAITGKDRPQEELTSGRYARLAGPFAPKKSTPAIGDYYDAVRELEKDRQIFKQSHPGEAYPNEERYQILQHGVKTMGQLGHLIKGDVPVGKGWAKGEAPADATKGQYRRQQIKIARDLLELSNNGMRR